MKDARTVKPQLGDEPPLIADRRRRPDRRQVSARWLAGTLLTGLTSTALMGIALSAAHDGRTSMASPAARVVASATAAVAEPSGLLEKGERVFATAIPLPRSRRTIEVSTLSMEGEREVIRTQPFAYASMLLAARQPSAPDYPAFDPLAVFTQDDDAKPDHGGETGQIYAARVEPDVALSMEPFDFSAASLDTIDDIGTAEAERLVRSTAGQLDQQPIQVAALTAFDPGRFDASADPTGYVPGSAFRVVQENVSVSPSDAPDVERERYLEEIVPFRQERSMAEALLESGYGEEDVERVVAPFAAILDRDTLEAGEVLRLGLRGRGEDESIVRISAYRGERHLATAALRGDGSMVKGPEPALSRSVAQAFDENATEAPLRADMPTVYDGIYQAALTHGLDERMTKRLVRLLAAEVDFQSRLSPSDRLTVLYSLEDGQDAASEDSDLLFIEAQFGDSTRRYYRFWSPESDTVDYYDEEGRSTRQFLLRNPVPTGRFTSNFGERRHPVLGYKRMHWGVDWAAPRGTPILASGSGTVKQAGWSSGYGRQTVIEHANGYQTSYSHQNSIAEGVSVGARVRQGQVIGTVGSTGLSTGNHLHYELSVNGKRVDPLRIRLPEGKALDGDELAAFQRERARIQMLLEESTQDLRVASQQ